MTSEDRKDALRYLPKFWHSLVQIIIQSRLGEKICTFSKSPKKGSSMFNIEMNTDEVSSQTVKEFYGNQALTPSNPFSVEILLKFQNEEQMVIEIWTLNIEDNYDSPSQNICQVTDRMTLLLKSVICVSRIIPAYKYSAVQNPNDYKMHYRFCIGKPRLQNLGEEQSELRVGQTNIHCGFLSVHVAYRTNFAKAPHPKTSTTEQPMMVLSDHFKMESSPKLNRITSERVSDSSETARTSASDESQDLNRYPFTMDLHHSSPRSRTSSESSYKGTLPCVSEKFFVPFAPKKTPSVDDYFLQEQSPSAQFLASAIEKLELEEMEYQKELQEKQKHRLKERKISETDSESTVKEKRTSARTIMNTSGQSNKSLASNAPREDEFVMLDMKTPFADTSTTSEFSAFFREWNSAPPLKMFSDDLYDDEEEDEASAHALCLKDQLKSFESHAEEYDELVKSFHAKDLHNSHEELGWLSCFFLFVLLYICFSLRITFIKCFIYT